MFFGRQSVKAVALPANYGALNAEGRRLVRKQYELAQKGLCYYCQADLRGPVPDDVLEKRVDKDLFPEGFFERPIHLHHDHTTGLTIGTVHAYCNAVLWQHHGE